MKGEFTVEMMVRIRQHQHGSYNDALNLTETMQMTASSFLELCEILAQFHRLAEKLNEGKQPT